VIRRVLLLLALLLVGVLAVGGVAVRGMYVPARAAADPEGGAPDPEPIEFRVDDGEPLGRVAARLDRVGLLPDAPLFGARVFVLFARAQGLDREIRSGDYDLSLAMTPNEILSKLASGQVKTFAVTIPEGLHIEDTAQRIADAGIAPQDELVRLARSPEFARALGVEADSLEGYLFPETYRFRRGTPAREVLESMVEQFFSNLTDEDWRRIEASGRTLHQVVTLASIVEKETGAAQERPMIAAVFLNRLTKRMRLQTDPTVIYGILRERGSFDGNLRKVDLRQDTPYNTYTRGGLPPGPIASVGLDSIRAVLDPADVRYLYFVSRNDGTHHFSKTLREHNNAVTRYQKRR